MEMIKFLVKIIIVLSINFPVYCKVINQPELERKTSIPNYGQSSVNHLNTTDTSINLTNATSEITPRKSDINALIAHMLFNQARTIPTKIDHYTEKFRTFLYSSKRIFKQLFMYYGHYGPEIGFCTCMLKYAWFQYPEMSHVTYRALGNARRMVTKFMSDFMEGFFQASQYDDGHERIGNKVREQTAQDYYDYQNSIVADYNPVRRNGEGGMDIPGNMQNLQVIEKADPKLISIVEMLKDLKPKVSQNDSFIIRYARALNLYSQKIHGVDDDDEKRRSAVSKDKIKKYRKKYQHELARKMNETSVGAVNSTSIDEKEMSGRGMRSLEVANNRRILVPGVPPGLPKFQDLPPADYTFVKNNIIHHVHDLRNGKYRPKRYFDDFMGEIEEAILGRFLGFPPPHELKGGPTVTSCAKGYAVSIVMRHIHMILFG